MTEQVNKMDRRMSLLALQLNRSSTVAVPHMELQQRPERNFLPNFTLAVTAQRANSMQCDGLHLRIPGGHFPPSPETRSNRTPIRWSTQEHS